MSGRTGIEWTDATWNPVTGCTKVSAGCKNCYAERFAERWRGIPGHPYEQGFDLKLHPGRLDQPLRWKKPRMVFVNSMSDLFHMRVPDSFILQVFQRMQEAEHHTFQVLTKRPDRMRAMAPLLASYLRETGSWPLPNVWIGTSVEDQATADQRIPSLLDTPAAVRFLSCEPLLGPIVSICRIRRDGFLGGEPSMTAIGWVIVGGESGPGARPMHPDWVRDIRAQCIEASVPFFFKQWGGTNKKKAGRELDGRTWEQMP